MMAALKRTVLLIAIVGFCTLLAFPAAYFWAFNGNFDCREDGCGILAELLLWPFLTVLNLLITSFIFWILGRRRIRKVQSADARVSNGSKALDGSAEEALNHLRSQLKSASLATVGGFRPPDDPVTSWFCRGVGHAGEGLPLWNGKPMFPLLQIRVDELPFVPQQLERVALIVLFHNLERHPFDLPNGEGWLIREYETLENLLPLPVVEHVYRPFPIRWTRIDDDAPGWEDAWSIVDLSAVNDDETAGEMFFEKFNRYSATKVGGYPKDIQHAVGLDNFVFQVASEEKVGWMWADNGIGYFFRAPSGEWRWSCQFY